MKTSDDDDDKNGNFDDIFTPLSSSLPRGSVIFFFKVSKHGRLIDTF